MSAPQQPIDLGPAPESVVEFGPPPERRRRWQSMGLPRGLSGDRRLVPVAAAMAAVAAFASLVSEWQVTTVDRVVFGGGGGGGGELAVPTNTADLGVFGTGYLIGVFGVTAMVVLTMFGPVGGRHYARLAGLSLAGVLAGMVLALGVSLGEQSRLVSRLYTLDLGEDRVQIAYGRGLWCALAAVLFALIALYLAGRHLPAAGAVVAADEAADDDDPVGVWSWRRPPAGPAEDDEPDDDEPLELTVSPAKPFTSLHDDRDKPN